MPPQGRIKKIQYMCRYCGKKQTMLQTVGRPMPGKCSRRKGDMPHSWIRNREM